MSLFHRLFLGCSMVFLLVFIGEGGYQFLSTKRFAQEQLISQAQDASTSLGLALSQLESVTHDRALTETVVNTVFERGYYQSIQVFDALGNLVVYNELGDRDRLVPNWFSKILRLDQPVSESFISHGWRQGGKVIVTAYLGFSYQKLWNSMLWLSGYISIMYALSLMVLLAVLNYILRPLKEVEAAACDALRLGQLPIIETEPKAKELSAFVRAFNLFSSRVQLMLQQELVVAERYRRRAFEDSITHLLNYEGFCHALQQHLNPRSEFFSGALVVLSLESQEKSEWMFSPEIQNTLLAQVAEALQNATANFPAISLARMDTFRFAFVWKEQVVGTIEEQLRLLLYRVNIIDAMQKNNCILRAGCVPCSPGRSLEEQLTLADMAVDRARTRPLGEPAVLWLGLSDSQLRTLKEWKKQIVSALKKHGLKMVFQPVFMAENTQQLLHYEIFARLQLSKNETVVAGQFISAARAAGVLIQLDRTLLQQLCQYIRKFPDSQPYFAINASHWDDSGAGIDLILKTLHENHDVIHRLVFEFTELGILSNKNTFIELAKKVVQLGAGVAVDHFGLHDVSVSLLQNLQLSYIKLSSALLDELESRPNQQMLIEVICRTAQQLNISVYATEVDRPELLPVLKRLGIFGVQGNFFAKPSPLDSI